MPLHSCRELEKEANMTYKPCIYIAGPYTKPADAEVTYAMNHFCPVFFSISELLKFYRVPEGGIIQV